MVLIVSSASKYPSFCKSMAVVAGCATGELETVPVTVENIVVV